MPDKQPVPQSADELDFLNLVLMLGNTASVELGVKSGKDAIASSYKNLPRARQFINMLKVIEKRTEARRTAQEDEVLKKLLEDLQQKYVAAAGLDHTDPEINQLGRLAANAYSKAKRPQP